jgi:hypothetical protein
LYRCYGKDHSRNDSIRRQAQNIAKSAERLF